MSSNPTGLYNHNFEKSSCGVGFITKKDSVQSHEILIKAHEALCSVPHRGGMSSEGVGDGAGISIDLSLDFFQKITSKQLIPGLFCVGNFFMPSDIDACNYAKNLIIDTLKKEKFNLLKIRDIPTNKKILNKSSILAQLEIKQFIFEIPKNILQKDTIIHECLLKIEAEAFVSVKLKELYPLSLSTKLQVLKGRLKSNEIIPYFKDLNDLDHKIHSLYFHTRFSTNTDPHPSMAQPFRFMAHNGELNTDKKNRLSENAIYRSKNKKIIRPRGQSDSCRLDQTLQNRIYEDKLDIVSAVVSMMPPAWENDNSLDNDVKSMFEYFSLYEEKNDGPAALIFGDGNIIGARLDRLGLRPLRTIETKDYICAMSEAGQIYFPENEILSRGRIEAGGIIYYNHEKKKVFNTRDTLKYLAGLKDYDNLLKLRRVNLNEVKEEVIPDVVSNTDNYLGNLNISARYVAYYHNQESFKFFLDPMLESGSEKVSAMGYGNAINALSDNEGGVAKYFSQRFAQVTNPPLDSIRESDGMTLRVALGSKSEIKNNKFPQLVINSPILNFTDFRKIKFQKYTPVKEFEILYEPDHKNTIENEKILKNRIDIICNEVCDFANKNGGIVILSDINVSKKQAAIPLVLMVSAVNQSLIQNGVRLNVSIVIDSGQICSSHHIACALGFGASAIYPLSVDLRISEMFSKEKEKSYIKFVKASEKSLLKIMGKVGLCTVESYSGGEFFEPNYLDTSDETLNKYFPNMHAPVGGVKFKSISQSSSDWHSRSKIVNDYKDIPMLGLFKERSEGAGHSYGITAVREFIDLAEEKITFKKPRKSEDSDKLRLFTLSQMEDAFRITEKGYVNSTFDVLDKKKIDNFSITKGYRTFSKMVDKERFKRPAALRDVLDFPIDFNKLNEFSEFKSELNKLDIFGNNNYYIRGIEVTKLLNNKFKIKLTNKENLSLRIVNLLKCFELFFKNNISDSYIKNNCIFIKVKGNSFTFFNNLHAAPNSISINSVQPAHEITKCFASGAMSHGALVSKAHEAVAHGTNMVGAMSNCGEGGEHISRYGTIRASKIKQFASGRFGVWAGYLADNMLEEIEIKIGQGAKPGEGGQLPASKVSVEIAAARGGVPGVELVSPPPHHDTYSIEDLAQLIHDAKAARVKVIVKLVSSDGIGTIAVGVAKAGADIINIAGGTGGTGAAAVTSLKYTGRSAEIGLAEVNQALCVNNIRQKVLLRCSGAHQTGSDVVKSAILGADSFEFGTSAMMMLKCVMAKNCNIKCPAGLTTNSEMFNGDPRALAQYFLNLAHDVREILALLGYKSIKDIRGRTDLLHLINHKSTVGQLDLKKMLKRIDEKIIVKPVYLEKNYEQDDFIFDAFKKKLKNDNSFTSKEIILNNRNKTFGGQLAIDVERFINNKSNKKNNSFLYTLPSGRKILKPRTLSVLTKGSAGQSYGAFCNDGMSLKHTGTCNDGVGKSMCGGEIVIKSPVRTNKRLISNVLTGNFCLFGATGGRLFVEGQAGDRFAVRNSGSTAVVEGVGDYCAEYMTNGTILNIGSYSSGYGNGMSGGFVYQYDPYKTLPNYISNESVIVEELSGNNSMVDIHETAILMLLNWHYEATNSSQAEYLLKNWSTEKENFSFVSPKSFLQYQDYEEILKSKTRKELIEELSLYLVQYQIKKLKDLWKNGHMVLNGMIPDVNDDDKSKLHELVNNWKIFSLAKSLVKKNVNFIENNEFQINQFVRDLILTEDFELTSQLMKLSKDAVSKYNDKELSVLIADKRINDFKNALKLRNVLSVDSPGTYGWILHQQRRNQEIISNMPTYEELFFNESMPGFVTT